MSFYGSLARMVGATLAKYGNADAQLIRRTPGTYDPATGMTAAGSEAVYPVRVLIDSSSFVSLGAKFGVDLVKAGDFQVTMAASAAPITPDAGDVLRVGVDELDLIGVQSSPSIVDAVVHTILARR